MTDCLLNPKPNSKQMDITDAWYIWTVSSSLAWSWHALLLNTSLRWLLELIKLSCLPYSSMFKTIDFIHAHYVVCYETFQPRKSDIFVILLSFSFFCDHCVWLIQVLTLRHYSAHCSHLIVVYTRRQLEHYESTCRW